MPTVEVRCPRCGAPCTLKSGSKGDYRCDHCGAVFRFVDSTKSTVVHDTLEHNCPICGRPTKAEEGFVCKECGTEHVCSNCVSEVAGRFICKDCLTQRFSIVGPSKACPKCSRSLTYIKEYNRWYCYNCQAYVQHICSKCGGQSRYYQKYDMWWCDNCKEYLQPKKTQVQGQTEPSPAPVPIVIETRPQKSGCFIATAAYGTSMAIEIDILRHFRDEELNHSLIGERLVALYYRLSPSIANIIARSKEMRAFVRLNLRPIVSTLKGRCARRH